MKALALPPLTRKAVAFAHAQGWRAGAYASVLAAAVGYGIGALAVRLGAPEWSADVSALGWMLAVCGLASAFCRYADEAGRADG